MKYNLENLGELIDALEALRKKHDSATTVSIVDGGITLEPVKLRYNKTLDTVVIEAEAR